ncbi:MAG: 23S rRNA (adenine(2030)-N(6))-methyltransferase RlmJ [Pseudomonadota bacterium]
MLSYRHAFHAGNFADVLKHLVLANTLEYAMRKAAPLFYLDTHAGAGVYRLGSDAAHKTGEASAGIKKLDFPALLKNAGAEGKAALQTYFDVVNPFLQQGQYPGSPMVAANMLRRTDHLHLSELHSTDYRLLLDLCEHDKRIHYEQEDGYSRIAALIPPVQKRAVILIDPSYELKEDYSRSIKAVANIYQRMPTAQVLLWYPVVLRTNIDWMISSLMKHKIRDLWQVELGVQEDNDSHGMTSSGLFLINPPWTLAGQLKECLPALQAQLAPGTGQWLVKNLAPE